MILFVLLYSHLNLQFLVNKCNIKVKWSCYKKNTIDCEAQHQKYIFSQFWKLLAWSGSGERSPPILEMATLSPCTHMAFPWFMNVETE